jgi:hypothetical protein
MVLCNLPPIAVRLAFRAWRAARALAAQQLYILPKGRACRPLGSIPPLSAHLLRRFAALKSVSLAHVTGLASSAWAARSISVFSSADRGIFMLSVLRSFGAFGGLPRVSMMINIPIKSAASTVAPIIFYGYNKYEQRKPSVALAHYRGPPQPAFA